MQANEAPERNPNTVGTNCSRLLPNVDETAAPSSTTSQFFPHIEVLPHVYQLRPVCQERKFTES